MLVGKIHNFLDQVGWVTINSIRIQFGDRVAAVYKIIHEDLNICKNICKVHLRMFCFPAAPEGKSYW